MNQAFLWTAKILLGGLLLGTSVAWAQPNQALKLVTGHVAPWGYVDAEGKPQGLLITFAQHLADHLSISVDNQLQPYARVIHSIRLGKADIAVMFTCEESERIAENLGVVVVNMPLLLVGPPGSTPLEKLRALAGKRVGYIRGTRFGEAFDDADYLEKFPLSHMNHGMAMMLSGRLEALVGTAQSLGFGLRALGLKPDNIVLLNYLGELTGSLYFSREAPHPQYKQAVLEALGKMRRSGALEEIFAPPVLARWAQEQKHKKTSAKERK